MVSRTLRIGETRFIGRRGVPLKLQPVNKGTQHAMIHAMIPDMITYKVLKPCAPESREE